MKIKVIRAIESGIKMQTVADTMGLTLEKVKEIRSRTNADIKAVTSFLQTATTTQKMMIAHVVRSSGGNELSSRRESLGVSRQTLRRWILAAELGLPGEYYPSAPTQSHTTMRQKSDKNATMIYKMAGDKSEDALVRLSELLGHSSPAITCRYIGLIQQVMMDIYDML